jgi:hypothetical protein
MNEVVVVLFVKKKKLAQGSPVGDDGLTFKSRKSLESTKSATEIQHRFTL